MTLDATGDDPIQLHIDSPGGTLEAAMCLIDVIDLLGVELTATCIGQAAGPALGPLVVAHHRRATPHARFRLCRAGLRAVGPGPGPRSLGGPQPGPPPAVHRTPGGHAGLVTRGPRAGPRHRPFPRRRRKPSSTGSSTRSAAPRPVSTPCPAPGWASRPGPDPFRPGGRGPVRPARQPVPGTPIVSTLTLHKIHYRRLFHVPERRRDRPGRAPLGPLGKTPGPRARPRRTRPFPAPRSGAVAVAAFPTVRTTRVPPVHAPIRDRP